MSKGHDRERQVKKLLIEDGWWVSRAAGSLGDADLVALKGKVVDAMARMDGGWNFVCETEARLIEVKANKAGGPYMNFRPADRGELKAAAKKAGATAWLCYWPAHKPIQWIPGSEWPT